MDTKIIEQLEEVFGNEFDLSEQDLGSLEDTVNEKVRLWVKGLLQNLGQRSKNVLCRKHQAKAHNDIKWPKSSILTGERLQKNKLSSIFCGFFP